MSNPYKAPKASENAGDIGKNRNSRGFKEPMIGCVVGGCCLPIILLIISAAFLGDIGGPLLWPIISVVFGLIGLVIGIFFKAVK